MPGLLEIGLVNAAAATALALLAAVASLVCRRPPVVYCLWLLVLVKLITPPLVRLPVELTGLVAPEPAQRPSTQTTGWRHEAGGEQPRGIAPAAMGDAPVAAPAANELGVANDPASLSFEWLYGDDRVGSMPREDTGAGLSLDETSTVSRWRTLPWALLIGGAWLAGSCGWWLLVAIRIARFSRLLRHSVPACARLQAEAAVLSRRIGLSRPPELRLVGGRVPPLLWTLGRRPLVLLPHALLDRLDHQQHVTLLAHELAHLRRRDHWVRWVELVVLGLYWWHPVAWWARRRFQQAEEQCCDAWVLWALPGLARSYAKALLETVEFLSEVRPVVPPAASGLGQVHLLKRRFAMILHDRWSPELSGPMRLAMLAVGLVALGISPWPLRLAAEPPADLDPAAAETAESEAAAASDDRDFAPTDTSAAPQPVPSATTPAADEALLPPDFQGGAGSVPSATTPAADTADTDAPISVSDGEGEITARQPVVGPGGVRRTRTVKVKGPATAEPHDDAIDLYAAGTVAAAGGDDVHQRLSRLERMVAQLVQEMRRSRDPRHADDEPADRYGAIRRRTKPEASDSGNVVEEDLFSPDPARTLKPRRRNARAEQLMLERNQLRARLEEIDRELGESAPQRK